MKNSSKKAAVAVGRRIGNSAMLALGLFVAAPTVAGAADAKTIVTTVCSACHGEDGNSMVPMFPKLAGLHPTYIAKQLNDYVSGKRKNDIMSPNVASLTSEDISALAEYFSKQQPAAPADELDAKLVEEGKIVYEDGNETTGAPACAGCHQSSGKGTAVYPRLAGQQREYLLNQLKSFSTAERSNDKNKLMSSVAERLSEQEMKAVAEYISSLAAKQ